MKNLKISLLTALCIHTCTSYTHNLVDIQSIEPTIVIDLRYATNNNFTKHKVYTINTCYLLKETAHRLKDVQQELKPMGLGLKIWDGFRPMAAQWKFWELVPDPRYVSDPRKGGRHTRGTTVDVTLIDLKTGKELVMPTGFDDFTQKAWSACLNLPVEAIKNRTLLHAVMHKYGFKAARTEWWHFDLNGWQNYPVLDVSPEELS